MTAGRLLWRRADARNCSNGFVACWWWCGYKELDEYEVMAADLAGKDSWGKGKNCSFLTEHWYLISFHVWAFCIVRGYTNNATYVFCPTE